MSSLSTLVSTDGVIKQGMSGNDVLALQLALSAAGYRVGQDGEFGPRTDMVVRQFQQQHGLVADGKVGGLTAALLDAPHPILVQTATPMLAPNGFPHDDTASLTAFYGKPWEDSGLIVSVMPPFPITYEGRPAQHIPFHRKAAQALTQALDAIAGAARSDPSVLKHVSKWSGSGNYRPVRGSSRLSTHAFWAANDFDAENLPLGHGVPSYEMPQVVVDAFKASGAFWGGDHIGRKDPMHFQYAHE